MGDDEGEALIEKKRKIRQNERTCDLGFSALFAGLCGFGGREYDSKNSHHDKAVLDLKLARDKLTQYQRNLENVMKKERELAKVLLREGRKRQATLALKKKKYQQQLLDRSFGQLNNIQQMIDTIEFAQIEAKVFQELKNGANALKQLNEEMSLEKVQQLRDDTEDALEYQREIEEALSSHLSIADNAEVEAELAELEKTSLLIDLPNAPPTALPTVQEPDEFEAIASRPQVKKKDKPNAEIALL